MIVVNFLTRYGVGPVLNLLIHQTIFQCDIFLNCITVFFNHPVKFYLTTSHLHIATSWLSSTSCAKDNRTGVHHTTPSSVVIYFCGTVDDVFADNRCFVCFYFPPLFFPCSTIFQVRSAWAKTNKNCFCRPHSSLAQVLATCLDEKHQSTNEGRSFLTKFQRNFR